MSDSPNPEPDKVAATPPQDGADASKAAARLDPPTVQEILSALGAEASDSVPQAAAAPDVEALTGAAAAAVAGGEPAADAATHAEAEPVDGPPAATEPVGVAADDDVAPEPTAEVPELPVAAAVADGETAAEAPRPRRRRSLALRFAFAFVVGVALVVGVGAGALYAWGQQFEGRVLPGVRVGSTDLSGLTRGEAQAAIAKAYESLGTGRIVLSGPDGQAVITFAAIDRGPDTSAILGAALSAGRQGEVLADLIGAPQAALHGVTLGSAVTYDRAKLVAAVDAVASQVDQAAVSASVTVAKDGSYQTLPSSDGRAVDATALLAALDAKLTTLDAPVDITADLPITAIPPSVTTAQADAARAAGDRMAADVVLTRGSDSWVISGASIRPLVSFVVAQDGSVAPAFNAGGLDPLLKTLATKVNQTPREATLNLSGNHVVASGTSREGRTLNVAATKAAIVAEIAARQAGTAPVPDPLAAVVTAVQPKLSSAAATASAPKMVVISSYSVYYWVIVNNHWGGNIEAPATKINGTVVAPGQIFDFWNVVGDLHKLPGEGPGNAIEGGKITVTGAFGGGICTTSTTLFNAAFRAGMIPLARQNHNEFINRYPPGLDATVWIVGNAKQTMSFKNDTQYPILIQRAITDAGSKRWLTFKIWSVPNGRTYKISNLVIQPGQRAIDTIVRDPTKPVGYAYRNNGPVDGAQVWVTVTIYDHGKLHWTKRYYSNYPAVNGVLVVGTG